MVLPGRKGASVMKKGERKPDAERRWRTARKGGGRGGVVAMHGAIPLIERERGRGSSGGKLYTTTTIESCQ